jgi:hypothetical protein
MSQLTVSRTKEYLILKIPLKSLDEGVISVSKKEKKAIEEGLKAIKQNNVSQTFNTQKEASTFLGDL